MHRRYIWFFIISIFVFTACVDNADSEEEYELQKTKIIAFQIDSVTSFRNRFYDLLNIQGKEVLAFPNNNDLSIRYFDLLTQEELPKTLFEEKNKYALKEIHGLYHFNPDSVLIIGDYGDQTFLLNKEGQVVNHYNFSNSDGGRYQGWGRTRINTGSKPFVYNHTLFIQGSSIDGIVHDIEKYFEETFVETRFNLETNIVSYFKKYPKSYLSGLGVYNPYISRIFDPHQNRILYSFGGDHHIYAYDLDSHEQSKYLAKSIQGNKVRKLTPGIEGPFGSEKERVESAQYYNLVFDPFRKVYYRFLRNSIDYKNPDGSLNSLEKAPISIVILDSSLKKIGESRLEGGKYRIQHQFVGRGGLYLSYNNLENEDIEEDKIKFALFTLEEIK